MKLAIACLTASLLLASALFAATETPRLSTANGSIASVDAAANSFVVRVIDQKGAGQDMTFVVADDSKLVRGGSSIGLVDLKQGDKVSITYQAKDGRNMVVNVGVEAKM
jgi:Cu/Ag efflux protein CusF